MGVKIPSGGPVHKTNDVSVGEESDRIIGIIFGFVPARRDYPFVVVVLVMIASDLLLIGTHGICLDVRVQQATTPAHIL